MLWSAFVGPAYTARSKSLDAEACVNLFLETAGKTQNAKQTALYGTPGLRNFTQVSESVCRGWFTQDGRTFTVIGTVLYEISVSGAWTSGLGTILNDGYPVSMASNGQGGNQLAIVGGGQLKILNLTTNVLSAAVVLPLTNAPVIIRFTDTYFLLLERDSLRFWYSALENGLLWDALDFIARSQTSDNLVGLDVVRNRIWVFGSETTEVYYNTGDGDVPFIPYAGSLMQEGLVSPYAEAVQGEAIMWVSQDAEGTSRIVRTTDYAPERISTPAIDFALASYPTLADAEALVYEQEGHQFIAWTFPQGGIPEGEDGVTWCYDNREGVWHQRAGWDEARGIFTRWRARGVAVPGDQNTVLVGDYANGNIYRLDMATYEDSSNTIRRLRRTPYLSEENQWLFVDRFELGIEPGVGLVSGQGIDPELMLRVSGDMSKTWGPVTTADMGALGEYETSAIWYCLGRHRADRIVFEVSLTDPVKTVLTPGVWIKARQGTGQR